MVFRVSTLSMESELDGKSRKEIELVIVGQISDVERIRQIAVGQEEQEQYSIKKPNGEIRIRKRDDECILTTKTWVPGVAGKKEAEGPCSIDQFEHFKQLADDGMIKTRFFYPLQQYAGAWLAEKPDAPYGGALYLEFDVFKDREGNYQPWIKIDLEYPDTITITPQQMLELIPDVGLTTPIINQWNTRTAEESAMMTEIYSKYFTVKN